MKNQAVSQRFGVLAVAFAFIAAMALAMVSVGEVLANHTTGTTHAGVQIGNQATATYQDGTGQSQTAFSNLVETVVAQIGAFTLTASQTLPVAVGGTVEFPHTLTNTGNGTDNFTVALAQVLPTPTDFTSFAIYADTDGDGRPDGLPIYQDLNGDGDVIDVGEVGSLTVPLAYFSAIPSGIAVKFVVVATVPLVLPALPSAVLTVTMNDVPGGTIPLAPAVVNTDTASITNSGVIDLTKSISSASGAANNMAAVYTYTLEYSNSGNTAATAVTFTDVVPTGMVYASDSGFWIGPNVNLSDLDETLASSDGGPDGAAAGGDDVVGIHYKFVGSTVTVVIDSIAPNQSGRVTFGVKLGVITLAPQLIQNTATMSYDPDGLGPALVVGPFNSNAVDFTALMTAGVTIAGPLLPQPSALQGQTLFFSNVVTNTGTGTDTFEMSIVSNTFPAGTTVQFLKSDGASPLIDTNGNGPADTGPIVPGNTYTVVLRVDLPPGVTGGGAYSVVKRATSAFNPLVFSVPDATDTLTTILGDLVDISNNAIGTLGGGSLAAIGTPNNTAATPTTSPWLTNTTAPGTTTIFTLVVRNAQGGTNDYNLSATGESATAGTPNAFPGAVPANCGGVNPPCWTIVFKEGAVPVTSTGSIAPGANKVFTAEVTVPALYPPGTQHVYFRAISPTSGTGTVDTKHDAITVTTVRAMAMTSSQTQQGFPGAFVTYQHQLTNTGNITETLIALKTENDQGTPAVAADFNGWTSLVFLDDGDGIAEFGVGGDTQIADLATLPAGIAPGGSVTLWVKVNVPAGAAAPTQNVTTLTATPTAVVSTIAHAAMINTDTTNVQSGTLQLTKEQALDLNCDGDTLDTVGALTEVPFQSFLLPAVQATGNLVGDAIPGSCILYRITATNLGNVNVTSVVINDVVPVNTKLESTPAMPIPAISGTPALAGPPTVTAPADGGIGNISTSAFTITPSGNAVLTFGVKVN